jgi:lyso-ornithine lipid O-acyltransferase
MPNLRPWVKLGTVFIVLCWYLGQLLILNSIRGRNSERGFRFRRKFCRKAISILNIKYQHSSAYDGGVCLYVSNHRSMLDPLIQLGYIDAFIVSKAEVGGYPVLGRGAKETGIILVHRHDQTSRRYALEAIEEKLREGFPVLIYPEGTTCNGDLTSEFRRGAIELARRLNIPIVPVMIEYPDHSYYWVDDPLLTYFKKILASPHRHNVFGKIGNVIKNDSPDSLVEETRAAIDNMILEARATNASI